MKGSPCHDIDLQLRSLDMSMYWLLQSVEVNFEFKIAFPSLNRQVFSLTHRNSLQVDDLCLDVSSIGGAVLLYQCHGQQGNQLWLYSAKVGARDRAHALTARWNAVLSCSVLDCAAPEFPPIFLFFYIHGFFTVRVQCFSPKHYFLLQLIFIALV